MNNADDRRLYTSLGFLVEQAIEAAFVGTPHGSNDRDNLELCVVPSRTGTGSAVSDREASVTADTARITSAPSKSVPSEKSE